MTILIAGGTGFIGQELRTILLSEGHNVIVVTRNPAKYADETAKNQKFISWEEDLTGVMNQIDAVINLAGEGIFNQRWSEEVKKKLYDSRIQSTKILVDAMRACHEKPEVFISSSASGYYGHNGSVIIKESHPSGDDFLAHICKDWEFESLKAEEFGVRVANPRIGIVLEKGGGVLDKMETPFRFFVGGPIGDGGQYVSWIHRTDLCNAILFPVSNRSLSGAYNACAPNPVTMDEFAHIMGEVMGRPALFKVPDFALKMLFGEAAKPMTDSARMSPQKLQDHGFEFIFTELNEALSDIL